MVVDTQLYDILGVSPDVSERDLKKAFMKRARDTHPDKNKDDPNATEKFQQVNEAYEILKDPQKREKYDQYGVDGLKDSGESAHFDDILAHLFGFDIGGGGGGRQQPRKKRTRDIVQETVVSLEDLFTGKERPIKYKRYVACKVCNATGTIDGQPSKECEKCGGQGQVVIEQHQGNSIFQSIARCPACEGRGEIIEEENKCKACKGMKLEEEEKEIEIHIEAGTEDGDRIIFHGASDEVPDAETGDLVVVVREDESEQKFIRNHNDLLYRKNVSLSSALFGARFPITHLDGRIIIVETNPKEIIEPGVVQVIEGEGMPIKGDQFKRGKLFIQYHVDFPKREQLTHEFRHSLCKVVPHKDEAKEIDQNAENVFKVKPQNSSLEEFENAARTKADRRNEAYRSDDDAYYEEEDAENGGVGCQPM